MIFPSKTAYKLSVAVLTLSILASAGGLLIGDLYRDSEFIKKAWIGNDLVTLFVVVPMLIAALVLSRRGSLRGQLIWLGLLAYMIYNYAFYLFGAAFNSFFLVYVALFTLSVYALILGLSGLDVREVARHFHEQTPVRWIGVFLLFISLPLGVVEISQCAGFLFTGKVPEAPSLIFALDLSVVVPNTALAAFLIWKRRAWGYVLSAIMLVKGFTYGVVLSVGTSVIAGFSLSGMWDPLMPFYVFVAFGSLIAGRALLKNLESGPKTN